MKREEGLIKDILKSWGDIAVQRHQLLIHFPKERRRCEQYHIAMKRI
jgi:hypothetical protein